jgi:predicted RNA-binding Zn-ribbon protein involved in translation (DUF1610 family)
MADRAVPVIIQLVMFYLVISWLVRLVRRRKRMSNEMPGRETRPESPPSTSPTLPRAQLPPQRVGIERRELMFNGVRWQVTIRPHSGLSSGARSVRRDVYVEEPPRCPKCGLGVAETRSWLGYTWSCPECGLRQRSSKSMQAVAEALARGLH